MSPWVSKKIEAYAWECLVNLEQVTCSNTLELCYPYRHRYFVAIHMTLLYLNSSSPLSMREWSCLWLFDLSMVCVGLLVVAWHAVLFVVDTHMMLFYPMFTLGYSVLRFSFRSFPALCFCGTQFWTLSVLDI